MAIAANTKAPTTITGTVTTITAAAVLFSSRQFLPYCMFRQLKHIGKYALRQGCIFLKTKRHTYRNAMSNGITFNMRSSRVHAYDSPRGHRIYALVHYARVRLILVDIVTKKLPQPFVAVAYDMQFILSHYT